MQIKSLEKYRFQFFLGISITFLLFIFMLTNLNSTIAAEDPEDPEDENGDDDGAGDFGWIAIALFGAGGIHILLFQINKLTLKYVPKTEKNEDFRNGVKNTYKKVKKPTFYLHIIVGTIGMGIILYHGLALISEDFERAIFGIFTISILAFYVISGAMVKSKIKFIVNFMKEHKKVRKYMFQIHTNLLLILIMIVLHVIHIAW